MELLKQNEEQANIVAARVMRITSAVFTLVYILNLVGIFKVKNVVMTITFIIGTLILWLPTLLVNGMKLKRPSLKYIIVGSSAILVTLLSVTLTYHVVALYVFAIALAALYFSSSSLVKASSRFISADSSLALTIIKPPFKFGR